MQEAMNSSDDMKSVMGIYDASLGARSNETSGKAIMAKLETLNIIGKISDREIRDALNWIEIERKFLNSEWQRCNS